MSQALYLKLLQNEEYISNDGMKGRLRGISFDQDPDWLETGEAYRKYIYTAKT